jgi:hypothetical protein
VSERREASEHAVLTAVRSSAEQQRVAPLGAQTPKALDDQRLVQLVEHGAERSVVARVEGVEASVPQVADEQGSAVRRPGYAAGCIQSTLRGYAVPRGAVSTRFVASWKFWSKTSIVPDAKFVAYRYQPLVL